MIYLFVGCKDIRALVAWAAATGDRQSTRTLGSEECSDSRSKGTYVHATCVSVRQRASAATTHDMQAFEDACVLGWAWRQAQKVKRVRGCEYRFVHTLRLQPVRLHHFA